METSGLLQHIQQCVSIKFPYEHLTLIKTCNYSLFQSKDVSEGRFLIIEMICDIQSTSYFL